MLLFGNLYGLDYDNHGGGCCGITHLNQFPTAAVVADLDDKVGWLNKAIAGIVVAESQRDDGDEDLDVTPASATHAVEVVITDQQLAVWGEALEQARFRPR